MADPLDRAPGIGDPDTDEDGPSYGATIRFVATCRNVYDEGGPVVARDPNSFPRPVGELWQFEDEVTRPTQAAANILFGAGEEPCSVALIDNEGAMVGDREVPLSEARGIAVGWLKECAFAERGDRKPRVDWIEVY